MYDEDEVPRLTFAEERERSLQRQREADERATAKFQRRTPTRPSYRDGFVVGKRRGDSLRVTDRP